MDYTRREVFRASPLALVAAEVRFNDSPRLRQQATLDAISIELESTLPVQGQQIDLNVRMGARGTPPVKVATGRVMKNASSTMAMTLADDRLTVETTAYSEFGDFREQVLACCRAVVDAGVTPALRRVGLRYIDEIRISGAGMTDARQWGEWIDRRLVDHLSVGPEDASVPQAEGIVTYVLGGGRGLNFRFGARSKGAVVSPDALVRKEFDLTRPFFVLDLDGYQDFVAPNATLLSVEVVAEALDAVHGPSGATFQNAITDAARKLFREGDV